MWFVYILQCSDKTFYTGISENLEERVDRHNIGRGSVYTKSRRPIILVYSECFETKSEARLREIEIKDFSSSNKKRLIKYGHGKEFAKIS